MIVYHVTLWKEKGSIQARGVLPSLSKGDFRASIWVTSARLEYAVESVAFKHNACPRRLLVCCARFNDQQFTPSGKPGIFYAQNPVQIIACWRHSSKRRI